MVLGDVEFLFSCSTRYLTCSLGSLVRYWVEHVLFSLCLRKGLNPSLKKKNVFLYSRYNQLSALPATLANCTKIDEFNIEGNNISELPVSGKSLLINHIFNNVNIYQFCFHYLAYVIIILIFTFSIDIKVLTMQ